MKIFQGKQADQIEAKVEQLEAELGIRGKGPIEERLALIVTETIALHQRAEGLAHALHRWKTPSKALAKAVATLTEMAKAEDRAEREERDRVRRVRENRRRSR